MIAQSVADILNHHVKLTVEGIDRMYLNVFVPRIPAELRIMQDLPRASRAAPPAVCGVDKEFQ